MCVNYTPPEMLGYVQRWKGTGLEGAEWPAETWKDYLAPIIRGHDGQWEHLLATYGMLPKSQYMTVNARFETVGEKTAYKSAWGNGHLCLVPMRNFFEPCYETGKAVRWRIRMADNSDFAVAGLWRANKGAGGVLTHSFTQLTINADHHPFMQKFHKPGDEKRSLVIVPPNDYDAFLECKNPEEARSFMRDFPAELMAGEPAEKQYGGKKSKAAAADGE